MRATQSGSVNGTIDNTDCVSKTEETNLVALSQFQLQLCDLCLTMAHSHLPSFNECFYSNGSLASADDLKAYKDQLVQFSLMLMGAVFYIQIGFAIIGAMINGVFIFGILQGLRKGILPYQLYYFLMSRAFCDFGSLSIMIVGLMLLVSQLVSERLISFLLCFTLLPYFTSFGTNC